MALVDRVGADGELRRLLEIRVPELIDYQDERYARAYVDFVARVRAAERAAVPGETRLSEAVARYLFKLMAYKDEYEVARLHLKADVARGLAEEFPGGVQVQYNLHPPLLRALGLTRKLKFGTWFDGAFRALRRDEGAARHRARSVRPRRGAARRAGADRRVPRADRAGAGRALRRRPTSARCRLARLPDVIRGYEDIKLRNVEKYREEVRALGV